MNHEPNLITKASLGDRVEGSGGRLELKCRWTITARIITASATHLGGDEGPIDATVLRDLFSGGPLLPGASLAGALRNHLADLINGFHDRVKQKNSGNELVSSLFGTGEGAGNQSLLLVYDSVGAIPDSLGLEIRDGVAIDPGTGTASAHKKFDMEVIPKGTVFDVRLDLLVRVQDDEALLLQLLASVLTGLEQGEIRLGARKTRGLGMCTAEDWRAQRFDLTTSAGWISWLESDHIQVNSGTQSHSSIFSALRAAHDNVPTEMISDARSRMVIDVDIHIPAGLLIRSPGLGPDAPDSTHLQSALKSIISGTSLGGVLRSRSLRIANTVRNDHCDGVVWVESLFGPMHGESEVDTEKDLHISRLTVSEAEISGETRLVTTRIAIDRFTGGASAGALFEEEVSYCGTARFIVELRNPEQGEMGLILLVVRDLILGDLPIGGSSSVGRGLVKGTAVIREIENAHRSLVGVDIGTRVGPAVASHFNSLVDEFRKSDKKGGQM